MSSIEDLISQFNEMGIIKKIIVGCCAVYLVLMIITLLGHAILGIPLDSFTEEAPNDYKDFDQLDLNGDGGLSFDEVKYYDHNSEFSISQSELQSIFDRCDKNDNGNNNEGCFGFGLTYALNLLIPCLFFIIIFEKSCTI